MGTCPNCGHKAIMLGKMECKLCHKGMCDKCAIYLFKIWNPDKVILDRWYVCSEKCLQDFASQVEKQVSPEDVGISEVLAPSKIPFLVRRTLLNSKNQNGLSAELRGKLFQVNFAPIGDLDETPARNPLWERLQKHVRLMVVQNLITSKNFEKAAEIYEKFGMYEEAGRIRARGKEVRIKKTEVSVDLNSLLRQLKDGGIVVVYRCPHCGGKLKIDKNASMDKLRVCEYCGSEIETMDLADFLKTALS